MSNPKHDRQGVRQAKDLERKYDLGSIGEIKNRQFQSTDISKLIQALSQYQATVNGELESLRTQISNSYSKTDIDQMFAEHLRVPNGYVITFYSENNEVLEFRSVTAGASINPPVYNANWVDGVGTIIVFPYTPTADVKLYAQPIV